MSNIINEDMLIFVNSNNNNNKFYHLKLLSNNNIEIVYGRVGTDGRKIFKYGGKYEYDKLIKSKIKKGYEPANISLENQSSISNNLIDKSSMLEIAMKQIKYNDSEVKDLITNLVNKNIHNITSNTNITFDKKSNLFTTPIGIVNAEGIIKAKKVLFEISELLKNSQGNLIIDDTFTNLNETYFKIIPTKIANLREKSRYMLVNERRINKQFDICNTLENTLKLLKDNALKNIDNKTEEIFQVTIDLLKNKKDFNRIVNKFEKSKNNLHGNYVNSAKINKIYKVNLNNEEKQFRNDLDNIMELWHGTKVVNLLSIFKSGLLMPTQTPGQKTGAMFGNGLYFSDQSTKSLNYCDGMFWNNSKKQDKIYMFLADVAMGNYEVPNGYRSKKPSSGYDSFFAKQGKSGVKNNEMIVFNTNQIKLKYLLEITI